MYACFLFYTFILTSSFISTKALSLDTARFQRSFECDPDQHRCKSNRCISDDDLCDGKADCPDGSDETQELCGNLQCPVFSFQCAYGACINQDLKCDGEGDCVDGSDETLPLCGATRPPNNGTCSKPSDPNVKLECHLDNKNVSCGRIPHGTGVKFICKPFYEDLSQRIPFRKCKNGEWNSPLPKCTPACGQKSIAKGTKKSHFPWHVAVYKINGLKIDHICGGSIVTTRIILSAAHCFTLESGQLEPIEWFMIGAGKYYRRHMDERDDDSSQYLQVHEVKIPRGYYGQGAFYASDIAVVILEGHLKIGEHVRPICIDWHNTYEATIDQHGVVNGWGNYSDELKEMEVPFVSHDRCSGNLPKDFIKYLLPGKICSGRIGEENKICQGDSGGGLAFYYNDKYFLQGIVSAAPSSNQTCNPDYYTLYTKVSHHLDFLKNEIFF